MRHSNRNRKSNLEQTVVTWMFLKVNDPYNSSEDRVLLSEAFQACMCISSALLKHPHFLSTLLETGEICQYTLSYFTSAVCQNLFLNEFEGRNCQSSCWIFTHIRSTSHNLKVWSHFHHSVRDLFSVLWIALRPATTGRDRVVEPVYFHI